MDCLNIIDWNHFFPSQDNNCLDEKQEKNLVSTVFTSSQSLLFAQFPLNKDDYNCVLILSPNLYYFQNNQSDYIPGCLIISNNEQYMEFNLQPNMVEWSTENTNDFRECICTITIPTKTRICSLNIIKKTVTWRYIEGQLKFNIIPTSDEHTNQANQGILENIVAKKSYSLNSSDIMINFRGCVQSIQIKGTLRLLDISDDRYKNFKKCQIKGEFIAKQYKSLEGFHGVFKWITINVKPKSADAHT